MTLPNRKHLLAFVSDLKDCQFHSQEAFWFLMEMATWRKMLSASTPSLGQPKHSKRAWLMLAFEALTVCLLKKREEFYFLKDMALSTVLGWSGSKEFYWKYMVILITILCACHTSASKKYIYGENMHHSSLDYLWPSAPFLACFQPISNILSFIQHSKL